MKKALHLLWLCLPILLLLTGCKGCKDTRQPNFTEGYYFYCKVNGNDFIPAKKTGVGGGKLTGSEIDTQSIYIYSLSTENKSIVIQTNNLDMISSYILDKKFNRNVTILNYAIFKKEDTSLGAASTDSSHTGILHITRLDKARKLVEGTFTFNAIDSTTMESVSITDGQFSLYYE